MEATTLRGWTRKAAAGGLLGAAALAFGLLAGCGGASGGKPAAGPAKAKPAKAGKGTAAPALGAGLVIPSPAPGTEVAPFDPARVENRVAVAEESAAALAAKATEEVFAACARLQTRPAAGPSGAVPPELVEAAARERLAAAERLGWLGDVRAGSFLVIVAEKDEVKPVRLAALAALGKLQDYANIPVLARLLADEDLDIALGSMAALNEVMDAPEMADPYAYDFLGGRDLASRKRTAARWDAWWKWWWGLRSSGREIPRRTNGAREAPPPPPPPPPPAETKAPPVEPPAAAPGTSAISIPVALPPVSPPPPPPAATEKAGG